MSTAGPVVFSWTEQERHLLGVLVSPDCDVETVVPKDPNPSDLWDSLTLCLRVHRYAERISGKLKPLIGRFLLLAKNHPESYEDNGYKSYGSFVKDYVVGAMQMSRSSLYDCRMLAERLPDLTPEQFQELGITKAKVLSSFTRSGDPGFPKYLAEAQERTATGFLQWAVEKNLIENGHLNPRVIVIQADEALDVRWQAFCQTPQIQAWVGSAAPCVILDALMSEALSSWLVEEVRG
jgi:hypothetical protein